MLKQWEKYLGVRYATEEEVNIYYKVQKILINVSDDIFDSIVNDTSTWLMTIGQPSYNARKRLARKGKKLGLTLKEIETWYNVE